MAVQAGGPKHLIALPVDCVMRPLLVLLLLVPLVASSAALAPAEACTDIMGTFVEMVQYDGPMDAANVACSKADNRYDENCDFTFSTFNPGSAMTPEARLCAVASGGLVNWGVFGTADAHDVCGYPSEYDPENYTGQDCMTNYGFFEGSSFDGAGGAEGAAGDDDGHCFWQTVADAWNSCWDSINVHAHWHDEADKAQTHSVTSYAHDFPRREEFRTGEAVATYAYNAYGSCDVVECE